MKSLEYKLLTDLHNLGPKTSAGKSPEDEDGTGKGSRAGCLLLSKLAGSLLHLAHLRQVRHDEAQSHESGVCSKPLAKAC